MTATRSDPPSPPPLPSAPAPRASVPEPLPLPPPAPGVSQRDPGPPGTGGIAAPPRLAGTATGENAVDTPREPAARATPWRLRIGAAAWFAGSAALGAAAVHLRPVRLAALAGVAATAGWSVLVAIGARREGAGAASPDVAAPATIEFAVPRPWAGETDAVRADCPIVSVVVAARDEAAVLPGLLADLAAQDFPSGGAPCFDVTLIDDGSRDSTPELIAAFRHEVRRPVVRVVRRAPGANGGKGGALAAVPADLLRGTFVCVLDADARIGPSFLREAAREACQHRAVTARRRILGREVSRWAALQDDEQAVDAFIQRGRRSLGGCSEFRGDGIVVERLLLEHAGGWARDTLTEDLDLSSRLATLGITVSVPRGLVVEETPVPDLRSFGVQRMRWAEGSIRRYLAHGGAVLRSASLSRGARLEFGLYGAQLSLPPLWLGAAVAGIVTRRPALALGIAGAYLIGGTATAHRALADDHPDERPGALLARSASVALFGASWAVIVPAAFVRLALRRRPAPHERTPRRRPPDG